ncbi:hypothetical protein HDV03_000499 [Kappamyces sp. JEL0829]|nr:hypothetical protein HDV03_000499 [Kappamyces sp. JEL0829]KAJ3370063.1 hypothetical protein HDU91_006618 [Kappamyces sp. JEL0680]
MKLATLYRPATVNPVNGKATTLPIFNIFDKYALNFHLAWLGFFVAFFSWFAFPPLMATIKGDVGLTTQDVLNSNVLGLTSTLLVRIVSGSLCDRFGPRRVMAGLLLIGAVPTLLAGFVTNAAGLISMRFFIGVLGGTFVPCQVWTTAFFDKEIVGTANAFAGGWGNAGGGVVFYVMPAVVNSLIAHSGFSVHTAWRWAFVFVPFVIITSTAILILLFGSDSPQGSWQDRYIPDPDGNKAESLKSNSVLTMENAPGAVAESSDIVVLRQRQEADYNEHHLTSFQIFYSPQTLLAALPYACTFGGELAVEGIISAWYTAQAKQSGLKWDEATAGGWASLFGLLNVFTRPLGGILSDYFYQKTGNVINKKWWMLSLGVIEGIMFVIVGALPSLNVYALIGLNCILAFGMEFGNGANYALVPHLNPSKNGFVSGVVGSAGNLGGIVFSLVFRYNTTNYAQSMWIIGCIILFLHAMVFWIPVLTPKTTKPVLKNTE